MSMWMVLLFWADGSLVSSEASEADCADGGTDPVTVAPNLLLMPNVGRVAQGAGYWPFGSGQRAGPQEVLGTVQLTVDNFRRLTGAGLASAVDVSLDGQGTVKGLNNAHNIFYRKGLRDGDRVRMVEVTRELNSMAGSEPPPLTRAHAWTKADLSSEDGIARSIAKRVAHVVGFFEQLAATSTEQQIQEEKLLLRCVGTHKDGNAFDIRVSTMEYKYGTLGVKLGSQDDEGTARVVVQRSAVPISSTGLQVGDVVHKVRGAGGRVLEVNDPYTATAFLNQWKMAVTTKGDKSPLEVTYSRRVEENVNAGTGNVVGAVLLQTDESE